MSLRRFHVRPDAVEGSRLTFDADEARHLARTLRLGPGDIVLALDGRGRQYTVRLERVGPDRATGRVLASEPGGAESPLTITLGQGVPKGDKIDTIIRAATELGVARIVPIVTARTVVRLDPTRAAERVRRWERVAKEAAKQCGRAVVPSVRRPCPLGEFLAATPPGALRLCLWEGEAPGLATVLGDAPDAVAAVTLLIGPEGGLAAAEVDAARAHGFATVSLGPRILRTETAGPAAIAIIQSRLGDIGRKPDRL